jgi:hypothetical protein
MNSGLIYSRLLESASAIQRHFGQAPTPDPELRAFFGAYLWLTGTFGIDTGDKASVMVGVPRAMVDYARLVLEDGNPLMFNPVRPGNISLRQASLLVRQGVKLVEVYNNSLPTDKAYLGHTVGPETVFDEVVVPALDPEGITTVVTPTFTAEVTPITAAETITSKSNGKATNGNGNGHLYARPAEPRIAVRVNTH